MTLEVKPNWEWEVENINNLIDKAQGHIRNEQYRIKELREQKARILKLASALP